MSDGNFGHWPPRTNKRNKPASWRQNNNGFGSGQRSGARRTSVKRNADHFGDDGHQSGGAYHTRSTSNQRRNAQAQQQQLSGWGLQSMVSMITGRNAPAREAEQALMEQNEARLAEVESENKELEKEVSKLLKQLDSRERQFEQDAEEINQEWDRCITDMERDHEDEVKKLKRQHDEEIKKRDEQIKKCNEQIKKYNEQNNQRIEAAKRESNITKAQDQAGQKSCRALEKQIQALNATVRSLQTASLQSVEAEQWAPLSSSDVDHQLRSIFSQVKQWSEEYGSLILAQRPGVEGLQRIVCLLNNRGCVPFPEKFLIGLARGKRIKKSAKVAAVLLAAAVSSDIVQSIIGDPTFAFVGDVDKDLLQKHEGKAFRDVIAHVGLVDEPGAQALRYQLMRLLEPPLSVQHANAAYLRKVAANSRQRAAQQVAENIVAEFMPGVSDDERRLAWLELTAIAQKATELSWKLWTRKPCFVVHDWSAIQNYEVNDRVYRSGAHYFEPHALHNKDLEDNNMALDGNEIGLLCSPLILAIGNGEGQEYDKSQVVRKAMVWID